MMPYPTPWLKAGPGLDMVDLLVSDLSLRLEEATTGERERLEHRSQNC